MDNIVLNYNNREIIVNKGITFKEGINVRKVATLISEKTNNSYEDVLNSVKYWLKLKYRCGDSDLDLSPITEYISKEGGYTKYYNFIIRNSNTVYNVARLFYGNDKAWLQFKCRTDRSIKEGN